MEKFIIKIIDNEGRFYLVGDDGDIYTSWKCAQIFDTKEEAEKVDISPYLADMKSRPDIYHIDTETARKEVVSVKIRETEESAGCYDEICRRDFYADIHGIYEP